VAKVAPSLLADLEEVAEYFRGRADVEDGDYGVPVPNEEMRLQRLVEEVIEELGRTT
jgi:hypothetical protein